VRPSLADLRPSRVTGRDRLALPPGRVNDQTGHPEPLRCVCRRGDRGDVRRAGDDDHSDPAQAGDRARRDPDHDLLLGASPLEVEDQITNKIEQEVAGINDLRRVTSNSQEGVSTVNLVFIDDADKNKALIDVVQALKRVTDLPELATEPEVQLITGGQGEQIMWLSVEGSVDINERWDIVDENLQPALLRVPGVGGVQFFGGVERKIVVEPDPLKLAQRNISLNQLAQAISAENINARGGYLEEGDRQFMVRTLGKYDSVQSVLGTVIRHDAQGTIKVGDVAHVIDGRIARSVLCTSTASRRLPSASTARAARTQ